MVLAVALVVLWQNSIETSVLFVRTSIRPTNCLLLVKRVVLVMSLCDSSVESLAETLFVMVVPSLPYNSNKEVLMLALARKPKRYPPFGDAAEVAAIQESI